MGYVIIIPFTLARLGVNTYTMAMADKIPIRVFEENLKLLMWYDQATTQMGDIEERPS